MKIYYCDNCQKTIGEYLKGYAFQTGQNLLGKTGTWCSKKCLKLYKEKTACIFEIGFNGLGMIIFACSKHGKPNTKYERAKKECYFILSRKIQDLLK